MPNSEKPVVKNFSSAIKRVFLELKVFKVLVTISLILAASGSILAIIAPNKLSKLTDTISEGLFINKDNFNVLNEKVSNNFKNIDMQSIIQSDLLTEEERNNLIISLSNIDYESEDSYKIFFQIPENVLEKNLSSIEVNNITISPIDQINYFKNGLKLNNESSTDEIYTALNSMPDTIKDVIKPHMDLNKVKAVTLFLVILYLISSIFSFIQNYLLATVSNNFAKNLRNRISKKINKLPLKFFDKNQTGDTLSRVTNDVDTLAQTMNTSLATLVSAITLFVGTVIMMFITNAVMALTAIVSSIIGFVLMGLVLKNSQKYFNARQVELGKLNSHIEEVYSGLIVVKAYNAKEEVKSKFEDCNKKVYDANRKSQFLSGIMIPMMGFIGNFGYVAVCVVGALLTINDVITFGVIVAFMTYVRLFTSPLSQIAQAFTALQSTAAASERVFEFLDEAEMTSEKDIKEKISKEDVKGNVEFKNIKFGYDENKLIIKDFNAKVKAGQKIAIVGPTGAGKTTIVNLLMKFYELNEGSIEIDGIKTSNLTRKNIHQLFTMVLQDTWLFNGTIRDNIKFNNKNVTDEEIMKICDIVGISHYIKTLPKGLDTILEENDSISAGQKQLLTIARAMIDPSPLLILDEATSNVDTRSEEMLQKAMDKLTKGKTSFIIAHRLSTIKNADLILVMKDGNIIEQGNHKKLLKQNGFYAELYNSQFQN